MNNMQVEKVNKLPNTAREKKPLLQNKHFRIINNSSASTTSSNNFIKLKKIKNKKNEKNSTSILEFVKKNVILKIKGNLKKYDCNIRKVYIKTINDIIYDERKHIVSVFKDYLFWDENSDFLKRFYKINESRERMPRISAYYQTYTIIRPIYFKLDCYKFLFKNSKRHRKRLDIIEEKLNNNSKKNNKNSKIDNHEINKTEYSKIVKSEFVKTDNITQNTCNHNQSLNENKLNKDNRSKNNFYSLSNEGEFSKKNDEFFLYEETKQNNNDNSNKKSDQEKILKAIIKLNDEGNKYKIVQLQLKGKKKDIESDKEYEVNSSFNKFNNSFSFVCQENLLDFNGNFIKYHKKNSDISQSQNRLNNDITESNKVLSKTNKNKYKEEYKLSLNKVNNKCIIEMNKKCDNKTTLQENSLFLDDISVIESSNWQMKKYDIDSNFINFPIEDHSFLNENNKFNQNFDANLYNKTTNEDRSLILKNITKLNDHNDITNYEVEEKLENKKTKNNIHTKTITNDNQLNKKNLINDVNKNSAPEIKKFNFKNLNLENITQNTAKSGKNLLNNKNYKNNTDSENRKFSEPIKKENKINLETNINNKIQKKIKSDSRNGKDKQNFNNNFKANALNHSSKRTAKNSSNTNTQNTNTQNNNMSKSEKDSEIKSNQNFKIIENMIKSIKMNNIDNLINLINSRSKRKNNKALTSREKEKGDMVILQDLYSRNINKDKLNYVKIESNDKFKNSEKIVNNFENSKINESRKSYIHNNLINNKENILQTDNFDHYIKTDLNMNTEPVCLKNEKSNSITKKNNISVNKNDDNPHSTKDVFNREKEIVKNTSKNTYNSKNKIQLNIKNMHTTTAQATKHNINNKMKNLEGNPSSIYNINLNLNLNLNVKMDKSKNSEVTNCKVGNNKCQDVIPSTFNNRNFSLKNSIVSSNLNKNNLISPYKSTENKDSNTMSRKNNEDDYNEMFSIHQGYLTERNNYLNIQQFQIKNNIKNQGNNNNQKYASGAIIPVNQYLEKSILNTKIQKSEKSHNKPYNIDFSKLSNLKILKNKNEQSKDILKKIANNYNSEKIIKSNKSSKKLDNFNNIEFIDDVNLNKKILEDEKKSRNLQANNLMSSGNFICNKMNLSDKYNSTQQNSLVNSNCNNNLICEKKLEYNIENTKSNNQSLAQTPNPNKNSNTANLKIKKNPENKIVFSNIVKKSNFENNFNKEQNININKKENASEKQRNSNTIFNNFSSFEINNSNNLNNQIKRELSRNPKNYDSLNNYKNIFDINKNDIDIENGNFNCTLEENYSKTLYKSDKKYNSISRNVNIKNLILYNDTTNLKKVAEANSLKNVDSNGNSLQYVNNSIKHNIISNNQVSEENRLINDNFLRNNLKNQINYNNPDNINSQSLNTINYNATYSIKKENLSNKKNLINVNSEKINSSLYPFTERTKSNINKDKILMEIGNNMVFFIKKEKVDSKILQENSIFNHKLNNDILNSMNLSKINNNNNYFSNSYSMKNNDINKQKIKIPVLNLKDINKNVNDQYDDIYENHNLTSARNKKKEILLNKHGHFNFVPNQRDPQTMRNENNFKRELFPLAFDIKKNDNNIIKKKNANPGPTKIQIVNENISNNNKNENIKTASIMIKDLKNNSERNAIKAIKDSFNNLVLKKK